MTYYNRQHFNKLIGFNEPANMSVVVIWVAGSFDLISCLRNYEEKLY
jgi:hypothetical protein